MASSQLAYRSGLPQMGAGPIFFELNRVQIGRFNCRAEHQPVRLFSNVLNEAHGYPRALKIPQNQIRVAVFGRLLVLCLFAERADAF